MLLAKSPLSFPVIREVKNFSYDKSKNYSICSNGRKTQPRTTTFCLQSKAKATLISNGNAAINKELETPLQVESAGNGIGIEKFFHEKNIFVTGGTGLLGKALVEKILRSTQVGKIYVLVKAEDPETAMDRLAKELVNSDLFGCLKEKHGKYYQEFMKEKLIGVVGNICEPNLGMDSHSAAKIMEEVNVIIESAAITTLNERYDLLIDANVKSPERLMKFAKTCKNLDLFVHISTAYVCGEEEGIILEKPMIMGENRRKVNSPGLDVADEINLASKSITTASNYETTRDMTRLGLERARLYGWHNAYHMTKAMAEMVINERRGDVPVLIIRPSAIESCHKDPIPGWIQGNRVFDPIIIIYGKGQLPAFIGKPDALIDVIPLDIVVNATIAAIAKHGNTYKPELNVYQIASSVANPLQYSEFFEYIYQYFSSNPLIESENSTGIDVAKIKYVDNFNDFSELSREEIYRRISMRNAAGGSAKTDQTLQKQWKAEVRYVERLCKLYEFLGFFKARFNADNTQKLLSEMSKDEQDSFGIDVCMIDWRKYFHEIHIPGLKKHVLR